MNRKRPGGFTLTEMIVSMAIFGLVMAGALAVVWICMRQWYASELIMRVSHGNSQALERLVYGAAGRGGLREAQSATVADGPNGWILTYDDADGVTHAYEYLRTEGDLVHTPTGQKVCRGVVFAEARTNDAQSGVSLRVDVAAAEGRFSCSNSMSTFVEFRNRRGT